MIDISSQSYELGPATLISTLSWIRWLLTAVLIAGLVTTVIAWLVRAVAHAFRAVFDTDDDESYTPSKLTWTADGDNTQFGICLSGGGIRSAAFSLGALSALEETPVDEPKPNGSAGLLGQADLLASVSGGGYAASAWRIAVGPEEGPRAQRPILGDPNECGTPHSRQKIRLTSPADRPTSMLFPRLLARRKYLATGRGGLLVTATWMVVQLFWHLGLLLAAIGLVAWPIGRMIQSPIITSNDGAIQYGRLATPGLLVFAVVAVVLVVRSFTTEGTGRTISNYAVLALSGLGTGLLTILVLLPWLVKVFIPRLGELLPGDSGATSTVFTVLTGGVIATIWRAIQAPLKTHAAYLGGALLALGLILFGGMISLHAAEGVRLFSGSWTGWVIAVGVYVALMSVVNPDLWSLHPIYRRRLASTFANRFGSKGWTGLDGKEDHLPMSAYLGAPGPKQVICAVAARTDRANTGVPVVSMTFEPDHVTVHPGPATDSVAIETASYERIFAGRMRARWLQSVVGLASMSAAAVAPSLGRMSMGSTNALIAALNLRLGVWMPNPMYTRGRRAGTHMYSMFKEILGLYDLSDPNIYVTDGGHWENLALVELIRRKTRIIIAVDASADPPHSFASVLEAVELSLLECGATVGFRAGEMEAMQPAGTRRPVKNWATADITYSDGTTGRLLYVKAQASQAMPLDVLRYSKEDPSFPNYSTANQFLSEAEFVNLAILGRESIIEALTDQTEWLFAPIGPQDPVIAEEEVSYGIESPPDSILVTESVMMDDMPMMVEDVPVMASDAAPEMDQTEVAVDTIEPVDEAVRAEVAEPDTTDQKAEEPVFKVKSPPPSRMAPAYPDQASQVKPLEPTGGLQ
jgi:hypothetical protein